jgi:AAA family ATP:ADP antiporter
MLLLRASRGRSAVHVPAAERKEHRSMPSNKNATAHAKHSRLIAAIDSLVVVQPHELRALLASFAMLFCLFTSYGMLRPVRETMGINSGVANLPYLFWGTFAAMLAVQPVYGWLTSRYRRTVFLPWVYLFFTANILLFYAWFNLQQDHVWIARTYFIWVSVFNLFVVAVFWSLMADVFTREQAGRMFGFVAAGASAGGLLGPQIAGQLARPLGTINLLPISAALLALSLIFMGLLIRWHRAFGTSARGAEADRALGGNTLAAFGQVLRSPYLLGIALFVLFVTWVSTFLYLEQQALVAKIFTTPDEQTRFFANIDFWVQVFSLCVQLFIYGRLYKWVGFRAMIASVPLLMTAGYVVFALIPTFTVVVAVLVVRRVGEYAISRPCRDTLYTVVSREEKYKAKSLIDTFIYRGGDATSGSLYKALTAGLGLGSTGIGWFGAVIAALWLLLAIALGRAHERDQQDSTMRT